MSMELFFGVLTGAFLGNVAGYFIAEMIKRWLSQRGSK
jgi:gas vesicle protein